MLKWPKEGEEVKLTLTKEFINWLCEVVTQATSVGFPAVVHSQNESAKHECNVIYGPGDFCCVIDRLQGVYFSLF